MKKSRLAAIMLFLLAAVSLIALQERFWPDPPEKLLVDAFQSSGADIVSSEIYFKGKAAPSKKLEEIEKIAIELATALDCTKNGLSEKNIDNDDLEGVEVNGTSGENRSVSISAVRSKGKTDGNCYITASIVDNAGAGDLSALRSKVANVFGKYGVNEPSVNSCMTGSYGGKLDNNLISVSAYTPSIVQAVEVNGQKVNLNLAVRFNSYEDKTYIWLATPVITTEY